MNGKKRKLKIEFTPKWIKVEGFRKKNIRFDCSFYSVFFFSFSLSRNGDVIWGGILVLGNILLRLISAAQFY